MGNDDSLILKYLYKMQKYQTVQITIGKIRLNAIVADSFIKKTIGLMFRSSLPKDTCMLFIFGSEGSHGIWMRNMLFPIDILWLDGNYRIAGMKENAKPCDSISCETYYPEKPGRYVVEFNAGTIKIMKINPSSKIKLGV